MSNDQNNNQQQQAKPKETPAKPEPPAIVRVREDCDPTKVRGSK